MVLNGSDEIKDIFDHCWEEYMEYLSEIASDIYDSCIKDYYNKYRPTVYDRHGHLEGRNLYQANRISFNENDIELVIDEYNLWEYKGREKRERVLSTVMEGIRGGGARRKKWRGWPKDWRTSYPNRFSNSKYLSVWSSSGNTMQDIFEDFKNTVVDKTSDYVVDLFFNSI